MDTLREYATQSILGAMQAVVVLYGILATATMMKVHGYQDAAVIWQDGSLFVRRFGLVLFAIPILWVSTTIYMEKYDPVFSKSYTLITGMSILAMLVFHLGQTAGNPTINILGTGPDY